MIDDFYKEIGARLVCIKKGTKSPNRQGWPDIQDRYEQVVEYYDASIHNKVGWILDPEHLVIDIDTHDPKKDGYESLGRLSEALGIDLYESATVRVKSPSGGAHLYFWKDPDVKLPKSCEKYAGLDFLSAGCQVITSGSYHDQQEGQYFFEKCAEFLSPIPADKLRDALIEKEDASTTGPVITYDGNECRPGDDFAKSQRGLEYLISEMQNAGYTFNRSHDPIRFSHPNKTDPDHDHSGNVGRWVNGHYSLWNFSSSDKTFPQNDTISIFAGLKFLKGWSWHETTLHLADMGFGIQLDVEDIKASVDMWTGRIDDFLDEAPETKNKLDQLPSYEIAKRVECRTFDELDELSGGLRRPYVIDGLLRVGEVMNVIAAPKVGKSWLVYNLALSTACGREFLGYRANKNLNVLLIDNELHWEELAWRMKQVASNMNAQPGDSLKISCLRGMDISLKGVEKLLDELGADQFDLIIIDALYRVLPAGASENDNAQMTQLYNHLDKIAGKSSSAVICIHHTSKGQQGTKDVTDVGAGAGAISRAADTHLVIRPHRDDPYFVINALTRSGKSPEPIVAELDWPLWIVAEDVLPELKQEGPPSKEDKKQANLDLCVQLVMRDSETTAKDISKETGMPESTVRTYCKELEEDGKLTLVKRPYKQTLIRQPSSGIKPQAEEWQP
jgi:hypothetical protein